MKTTSILQGCGLHWQSLPSAWPALQASLNFQAQALGLHLGHDSRFEQSVDNSANGKLTLQLPEQARITLQISAWQQEGAPAHSDELSMQAASGLIAVHSRARGQLQALPLPYLSCVTAALGLQGLLAAALAHTRGSALQSVSCSVQSAAQLVLSQYRAAALAGEKQAVQPIASSEWQGPPFCAQDGIWFELEALEPESWRAFCQQLDLPAAVAEHSWRAFMLRYARACAPLPAALAQRLTQLPYAQIVQLANAAQVAICALASDAQTRLQASAPWQFGDGTSSATLPSLPPQTGTLPLAGLTVIESCRRIQGPLAGHLLAQLGARVIRIEPPGGDPLRAMPPLIGQVSARFAALNQNKEVQEVNLKTPAGRARVKELARDADIFLHNWAADKAQQMQLDSADLHRINPRLLYAYAGGWGEHDAEIALPGTDFMVQAYSGLASRIHQAPGAPGGTLFTMLDMLGGVLAAQGICAALLGKQLAQTEKRVARVDTSLLGAAALLQQACDSAPDNQAMAVPAVWHCADGELICSGTQTALASALDCAPDTLAGYLQTQTPPAICARLQQAGLPAAQIRHDLADELVDDLADDLSPPAAANLASATTAIPTAVPIIPVWSFA